jgi:outer membrane protein assembly factor BamB
MKTKFLLLSVGLAITVCNAAVLEVGTGGKYTKIQAAWKAAKTGDEIIVHAGTYKPWTNGRCLQVKDSKSGIILRTAGDGPVVCKGSFYFYRGKFDSILIEGFQFINANRGIWLDARGDATYSNIIIRDNVIANCKFEGFYFYNKIRDIRYRNILVEHNTIYKTMFGIRRYVANNGAKYNCVFRNNIASENQVGFYRWGTVKFDYSDAWKNINKKGANNDWPGGKGKGCVSIDPVFASTDPASPDFMKLSTKSPVSVLKGGEGGTFMGAYGLNGPIKRTDYAELLKKFKAGVPATPQKVVALVAAKLNISGKVYIDVNANGKLDSGENGLAGVAVSDGERVVSSNAKGEYSFKAVPADILNCVYISVPNGYAATTEFYISLTKNRTDANFGLKPDAASLKKDFTFIQGADIQFFLSKERQKWRDTYTAMKRIAKSANAKFFVCVGDLTPLGMPVNLQAIRDETDHGPIPFHAIFGGHDGIDCDRSLTNYVKAFGPSAYSWNYGGVHFVALVSETTFASKREMKRQFNWLKNDLAKISKNTPVIICTHVPGNITPELKKLAASHRVVAVLMGHWHTHHHFVLAGIPFFCSSPWRDQDWGAATNRVRVITWENGKLSSRTVPMWERKAPVSFKTSPLVASPKGNWDTFFGPEGNRSAKVKIKLPLKPAWTVALGKRQPFFGSPVISNGKIYFGVADGQAGFKNSGIACFSAVDGKQLWKTSLPGDFYSTVAVQGNNVFALNAVGMLYALNAADGKKIWQSDMFLKSNLFSRDRHYTLSDFGWRICMGPITLKDNKIFTTGVYSAAAFNANNGKRMWFTAGLGNLSYPAAGVAVGGGKVYGEDQARLFALSEVDGKKVWDKKFNTLIGKVRRERGVSTPTFADNAIYFVSRLRMRKLTPEGKELWSTAIGDSLTYSGAAAISDDIAVIGHGGLIMALNAADGKIIWRFRTKSVSKTGFGKYHVLRNGSSPAIADGKVFCGSDDGFLYVLDLKTGKMLQGVKLGSPIKASVALANGFVCIADFDGRLHAFKSR